MSTDILTRSIDSARTGANTTEVVLTPFAVKTRGVKTLLTLQTDDPRIEAQPLRMAEAWPTPLRSRFQAILQSPMLRLFLLACLAIALLDARELLLVFGAQTQFPGNDFFREITFADE